jgi:lysophospholipase L1-like esterase
MNRRNFFRKTALISASSLFISEISHAAIPGISSVTENQGNKLRKNAIILFQGDSITDAGRQREDENKPNDQQMLGRGYPLFATANLRAKYADKDLKIYNRGISGNKVFQLAERWDKDCINLKPDLISILIGVNDYWHKRNDKYDGTLETYETDYRALLEQTLKALPDVKIVICEPFIIHGGTALDDTWEPVFSGYRNAAGTLAKEFKLSFVPFQSVFNKALEKAPASYWGPDGVHPSLAGAQLMADAWMKVAL